MSARTAILNEIRRGVARAAKAAPPATMGPEARLAQPPRGTIPGRSRLPHQEQVALFIAEAQRVGATVARLAKLDDVPQAIGTYLAQENLPARIKMAPDPQLDTIPWAKMPTLAIARGKAEDKDEVSVTGCLAGVAETGTLVMASGADHPTTLNFLPETHVVVVHADQITGAYEEAFDNLKKRYETMPRAVNLVTGPSRTGDIEQTIYMGAHGPRRLHILVVDEP